MSCIDCLQFAYGYCTNAVFTLIAYKLLMIL